MRKIFKGVLMLLVFTIALAFMPVSQAMADETFSYKSPDFTLTVPQWNKEKSKNPETVFRMVAPMGLPTLEVTVSDMPAGMAYKDSVKGVIKVLEDMWEASNCKPLYEGEIKLKDGTPAYEFELQWNHPMALIYTYEVVAFKDKKVIYVGVSSGEKVDDKLKQYPLSLTLQ